MAQARANQRAGRAVTNLKGPGKKPSSTSKTSGNRRDKLLDIADMCLLVCWDVKAHQLGTASPTTVYLWHLLVGKRKGPSHKVETLERGVSLFR